MKVAYLFGSLNRGGTETLYLDFFRKVKNPLFDVVGLYRKNGSLSDDFLSSGIRMIHLPVKKHGVVGYLRLLRKSIDSEHIDVVHAQQTGDCMVALAANRRRTAKIVLTVHCFDSGSGVLKRYMMRLAFRKADAVCFVSETQKQFYVEKYNLKNSSKLHVVYNGVDFSKLDNANSEEVNLPLKSGTKKECLKLAMVGNFGPVRDHFTICRFLKAIRDKGVAYHFYFIGKKNDSSPELFENCKRYCQENGLSNYVDFLGSRGDVPELLKQMDAFVYSTERDTFGIAVVEAIASGLPVFVNDWGVMKEITNNGAWATLYETKNVEDLCVKFMDFVKYQLEYKEKAKNNAIAVRNEYSIERFADKLWKVYRTL